MFKLVYLFLSSVANSFLGAFPVTRAASNSVAAILYLTARPLSLSTAPAGGLILRSQLIASGFRVDCQKPANRNHAKIRNHRRTIARDVTDRTLFIPLCL